MKKGQNTSSSSLTAAVVEGLPLGEEEVATLSPSPRAQELSAPTVSPAASSLDALKASCAAVEAELAESTSVALLHHHHRQQQPAADVSAKVDRLRRVLLFLYAALDQYQGGSVPVAAPASPEVGVVEVPVGASEPQLRLQHRKPSSSSVRAAPIAEADGDDESFEDALDNEALLVSLAASAKTPETAPSMETRRRTSESTVQYTSSAISDGASLIVSPTAYTTATPVDIYADALREVRSGRVRCRKERIAITGSTDMDDFLSRLACVRQATDLIMCRPEVASSIIPACRELMSRVLARAGDDPVPFQTGFDEITRYVSSLNLNADGVKEGLARELAREKIESFSFFDIVIDFTLLDAFDDVEVCGPAVRICD